MRRRDETKAYSTVGEKKRVRNPSALKVRSRPLGFFRSQLAADELNRRRVPRRFRRGARAWRTERAYSTVQYREGVPRTAYVRGVCGARARARSLHVDDEGMIDRHEYRFFVLHVFDLFQTNDVGDIHHF